MKIIGIVGWKDTGKTTLIEKLIGELDKRNLTVSTIKHSHHKVSIDKRGTDSFRHFNAGAKETILTSETTWVKFSRHISDSQAELSLFIKQIMPVDILIIEGFKASGHKKIEVVNSMNKRKPLYETDKTICGLIYDQNKIRNTLLPQFKRDDIQEICNFIIAILGVE